MTVHCYGALSHVITWLVENVTYFDLIGRNDGSGREFKRSKYNFPHTLELTDNQMKCHNAVILT